VVCTNIFYYIHTGVSILAVQNWSVEESLVREAFKTKVCAQKLLLAVCMPTTSDGDDFRTTTGVRVEIVHVEIDSDEDGFVRVGVRVHVWTSDTLLDSEQVSVIKCRIADVLGERCPLPAPRDRPCQLRVTIP
jgi:hypothetical protein